MPTPADGRADSDLNTAVAGAVMILRRWFEDGRADFKARDLKDSLLQEVGSDRLVESVIELLIATGKVQRVPLEEYPEMERRLRASPLGSSPYAQHRYLGVRFRILGSIVATKPLAAPKCEETPVDDVAAKAARYAALLVSVKSLADGSLKGIQRRVTVLLVEAGGTKAIADIATDKGVGWLAPFKGSVDGYLKGVRPKLQPLGADVKPFDQELRLVLQEKPTRPRHSTKKAAPPKRRKSAASLPPKRR